MDLPNPGHEWNSRDRGLAEGLIEYEDSLLNGIPAWIALDDEAGSWLEAVPVIDHAQAARERAQKDDKDPEPGTRYRVVDTRVTPSLKD